MSTTRTRPPVGWSGTKVFAVLLALLCVGLMAAALRVSDSAGDYQVVQGTVGQPVAVRGGHLSADQVRVATALSREGEITGETPGLFVVVQVRITATGNRDISLTTPQLLTSDGRTYVPYSSNLLKAVSGFQTTADVVFEVDPSRMNDLTLQLWEGETVFQYPQRARIHLGITPANADQWRAAGRDQTLEPRRSELTEALP